MKVIDAQVHIWSKTVVPTSGQHRKVSKFTAEELLKEMDEASRRCPDPSALWVGSRCQCACG